MMFDPREGRVAIARLSHFFLKLLSKKLQMRPLFIHNVDFIQLLLPLDEVITYFPASSHLKGKRIQTLHLLDNLGGKDLSGNFPLSYLYRAYISLYNVSGDLIIDNLPVAYFSGDYDGDTPVINDVIDWEKSFITFYNRSDFQSSTTCMFFSVFMAGSEYPIPELSKQYTVELDVEPGTTEISLLNKANFLQDKKITAIYCCAEFNSGGSVKRPILAYLYLTPRESGRYVNYIPLKSLLNVPPVAVTSGGFSSIEPLPKYYFLQNVFIHPSYIDFDKCKILIRQTIGSSQKIKLQLYYE